MQQDAIAENQGPDSFYCAITGELMLDPVIDYEGNTFERAAIEAWLLKNATSPVTRSPLSIDKLAPNRALKEAIDAFRAANAKHVAKIAPKALAGSIALTCRAFERAGDEGTHDVVITMDAGAGVARSPVDLVCVIDISGSMDSEATVADASGKKEEHGLSLLDITKHAVATVINTLGPSDRLALVTYSDKARVDFPLSQMNIKGQQKASDVLAKMKTEGSTNLWDGLKTGMDVLRDSERQGRIPSVFLLTDGQPNVAPPRGHLEMLKRYKDENKINFTVQTFGFGYNLDSKLLDELATEGGGAYAFVPEPMFVGTSFVNALANTLTTAGFDASLSLEAVNGAVLNKVLGGHGVEQASWGAKVALGTLLFGQVRTIVARADLSKVPAGKAYFNATLQYVDRSGVTNSVMESGSAAPVALSAEAASHFARALACSALQDVISNMAKANTPIKTARQIVAAAIAEIKKWEMGHKHTGELLRDMEGQVSEATSRDDWWKKWGRHYLPSLLRAHQLMQANNFKDPGVQIYGGKLFQSLRDTADAVFLKLPPPKPTIKKHDGSSHAQMASMAAYNNSAGVCFSPESLVLMADGSLRRCDEIRAGDKVHGGAVVKCVVQTMCGESQQQSLVRLSATMRATPWHPVLMEGKWTFPIHVAPVRNEHCTATWNYVLSAGHEMIVGGIKCATLGHGIVNEPGDVRSSTYWGRDVVKDLAQMPGFEVGMVVIHEPEIVRNHETQLVVKLIDCAAN